MSELPLRSPHARTRIVGKSAQEAADHATTDLPTMIELLLIALLLARIVMLRFPEIGALVTQYNQF